jgi:hypothetical protein
MTTATIIWQHGADSTEGSVAATLAMTSEAWADAGAAFVHVDDGDGDQPGLAVGQVEIDGQPRSFGVLDYGDGETTFLVVAGDRGDRPTLTARIVEELLAAHVIAARTDVLEVVGLDHEASTDEKLEYTLSAMNAQLAEAQAEVQQTMSRLNEQMESAFARVQTSHRFARSSILAATLRASRLNHLLGILDVPRVENVFITKVGVDHRLRYGDIGNLRALQAEVWKGQERLAVSAVAPSEFLRRVVSGTGPTIPARMARFHPATGAAVVIVDLGETLWPITLTGLASPWRDIEGVDLIIAARSPEEPSVDAVVGEFQKQYGIAARPGQPKIYSSHLGGGLKRTRLVFERVSDPKK